MLGSAYHYARSNGERRIAARRICARCAALFSLWIIAGLWAESGSTPGRSFSSVIISDASAAEPDLTRIAAHIDERNRRADALHGQGKYAEMLHLAKETMELAIRELGERHPRTLDSTNSYALALKALGRTADAMPYYEKVLRLRSEDLKERHPDTMQSLNNYASALKALGRTIEAMPYYEKALRLRTEVLGERHPATLRSLNNYASALKALGRTSEAMPYFEKALRLRIEDRGDRDPDTLRSLNNYASALHASGRTAEAMPYYEKALRLRREVLGDRHPDTLISLSNYAVALHALGRTAEAMPSFAEALRLRTEVLSNRHPATLTSLTVYAKGLDAMGRTAEAERYYEKALRLRTEVLGERHPDTLNSLANEAILLHRIGQWSQALPDWEKYVSGVEDLRREAARESVETQRSVFAEYVRGYHGYARTLQALGRTPDAFGVVERTKSRTLLEQMTSTAALRSGVLSESEARSLEEKSARLSALDSQIGETGDEAKREALKQERNALSRTLAEEQSRLRAQNPRYAQLTEVTLARVEDAGQLISPSAVFVNYMVSGTEEVFALTLNQRGEVRWHDLGKIVGLAESIEAQRVWLSGERSAYVIVTWEQDGKPRWRAVHRQSRCEEQSTPAPQRVRGTQLLRAEIVLETATSALSNCLPPEHQRYDDRAREQDAAGRERLLGYLRERLLDPLKAQLEDKDTLIVSPDGPLGLVAFDALPWAEGRLIERFEVTQVQSLSVLKLIHTRLKAYGTLDKQRPALMAMGNPNYENLAVEPRAGQDRGAQGKPREGVHRSPFERGERPERAGRAKLQWPNLPYTQAELEAATRLFASQGAKSYRWNEASEEKLRSLSQAGELEAYRYLLFPAHGYFDAQEPENSALVLKGEPSEQETQRDGYVSTGEWPAMRLRSELTILSACETARGKSLTGEGLMGLAYALYVAGNANALLTLWRVDDERTQRFVTAMLTRLKAGERAGQALRNTKLEFIQSSGIL